MSNSVGPIMVLLAVVYQVNAQNTVLVTRDRDLYYEEYSVLESDKKTRHGSYTRLSKSLGIYAFEFVGNYSNGLKSGIWEDYYTKSNNIKSRGFYKNDIQDSTWVYFYPQDGVKKLVDVETSEGTYIQIENARPVMSCSGNYKNGKMVGIWEYYNWFGQIFQKFDFDKHELVFFANHDLSEVDESFIGGEFFMKQYLNEKFDFDGLMKSINSKIHLHTGNLIFNFDVNEKGEVGNIVELEKGNANKKLYARAIETINSLNRRWYPKMVNGVPHTSTKKISFLVGSVQHGRMWEVMMQILVE